jgi:hypothetical protein
MFWDMNFRLGQKVLKDCGIHFCYLIVSISTHQSVLRFVASSLNCVSRGITPKFTRKHTGYLHGLRDIRTDEASAVPYNSGILDTPRDSKPQRASWRRFERTEIHLVRARIPFTFTMLCRPILGLPHKTANEFWVVRHYT